MENCCGKQKTFEGYLKAKKMFKMEFEASHLLKSLRNINAIKRFLLQIKVKKSIEKYIAEEDRRYDMNLSENEVDEDLHACQFQNYLSQVAEHDCLSHDESSAPSLEMSNLSINKHYRSEKKAREVVSL